MSNNIKKKKKKFKCQYNREEAAPGLTNLECIEFTFKVDLSTRNTPE